MHTTLSLALHTVDSRAVYCDITHAEGARPCQDGMITLLDAGSVGTADGVDDLFEQMIAELDRGSPSTAH